MLIFDGENKKYISNIILMIKIEEAIQLKGAIDALIKNEKTGVKTFHSHINNEEYSKEVTVSIDEFTPIIKDMIKKGE